MTEAAVQTLQKLKELDIDYTVTEHEAVYTIEDMERLQLDEKGKILKKMFPEQYLKDLQSCCKYHDITNQLSVT